MALLKEGLLYVHELDFKVPLLEKLGIIKGLWYQVRECEMKLQFPQISF